MKFITLKDSTDAKVVEAEIIAEKYDQGRVTFLGEEKVNGTFYAIYESKKLPLVFYAVEVMQSHSE